MRWGKRTQFFLEVMKRGGVLREAHWYHEAGHPTIDIISYPWEHYTIRQVDFDRMLERGLIEVQYHYWDPRHHSPFYIYKEGSSNALA